MVESQSFVATRDLTDSIAEHEILEAEIERFKPAKQDNKAGTLDFLLHTPFRYPRGEGSSRFSSRYFGSQFYAAEQIDTALAEMSFRRWCLLDGMGADETVVHRMPMTVFSAHVSTFRGVDLTRPPFNAFLESISHPTDYSESHALGDAMQAEHVGAARYRSARDPGGGNCVVVFTPDAFANPAPTDHQSWQMRIQGERIEWTRMAFPGRATVFSRASMLVDGKLPRPGLRR